MVTRNGVLRYGFTKRNRPHKQPNKRGETTVIDLASISKSSPRKPRIVIYGPSGIGKTTFASCAPNPIFILTEDGLGDIEVARLPMSEEGSENPPIATSFQEVLDYLGALGEQEHNFKTVVIDSLDWLEALVWEATCKRCGAASIEDIGGGYGKGYIATDVEWKEFFDALTYLRDVKGMYVIMIAHGAIVNIKDPVRPSYDMHDLKLNKRASAKAVEFADVVGFASLKILLTTEKEAFEKVRNRAILVSEDHVLHLAGAASYVAKNRYHMPDEIPLDWTEFEKYLPGYVPPEEQTSVTGGN